jgi:predicted lipoprotein
MVVIRCRKVGKIQPYRYAYWQSLFQANNLSLRIVSIVELFQSQSIEILVTRASILNTAGFVYGAFQDLISGAKYG